MWVKAPAASTDLYVPPFTPYIAPIMRPETERSIAEIQQAIALLRRHL